MKKDEALKLALEALEAALSDDQPYIDKSQAAITAIKQALAAPVQEPVEDEWTPCMKLPVVVHVRNQRPGESHVSTREGITPVKPDDLIMRGISGEEYPIGRAIFEQTYTLDTTPPAAQRKWVGLTRDEVINLLPDDDAPISIGEAFWTFAGLVDAKLKQKNGL
jgi:hypothetical protein